MIILDTNVLSELTRKVPDPRVLAWMDHQQPSELSTTAVTAAELRYGVARLPAGRRRRKLTVAISELLNQDFHDKILPFDERAAMRYADLLAVAEKAGRTMETADAQIAAICRDLDASLATRNTGDFKDLGISLINPWEWEAPSGNSDPGPAKS